MNSGTGDRIQTIGTAELQSEVESALCRHFGNECRIVQFQRRLSDYRSSFTIEELDLQLADGRCLELMFKNLSRHAMLAEASQTKPQFLYDPLREIQAYRTVLADCQFGTAICYGTVVDQPGDRYWLFLEKVPGIQLNHVGEFSVWLHVARWLAEMHIRLSVETELEACQAHFVKYDSEFYLRWLSRAKSFVRETAVKFDDNGRRQKFEWLAERYDKVVAHLVALPQTIIHGEFYARNVLTHQSDGKLRICPVDWETAGLGPGLIDLAALTAGRWTAQEKESLAMAYYDALETDRPDKQEFLTAFDFCHVYLGMLWVGWARQWYSKPPRRHKRSNWLDEAVRLAEKLHL